MPSGKSKYERKSDPSRQTGWENLKTDINYNGIFPNTFDASKYKSKRFKSQSGDLIDEAALNSRSVIHELGHWMGLRHEYCGLCGYWMHSSFGKSDDKKFNQNKANKYWATRYDAGSIMDSIGLRLQNAALEILKVKGLQPASVSALQDKTVQGVINRINISLGLSPYDQANIALLYPGSNLVNAGAVGTFVLKPSKDTSSQSLVESYLKCMQLYSAAYLETITTPLKARKWQTARKAYLDFVAKTQKDEAASLLEYQTFIANKLVVTGTDIKGVFDVTLNSDASLKRKYHMVLKTRPRHDLARLFPAVMAHSFLSSTRSWALCITLVGDNTWHCSFQPASSPVVVNEAEFALSDALYPVVPIVGGPNGQTLSKNYSRALNSLIPTFENADVRKQPVKMRAWLMKETKFGNAAFTVDIGLSIPGINSATTKQLSDSTGMTITPGPSTGEPLTDQAAANDMAQQAINAIKNSARRDPRGMTRMEYSDSLMQVYLDDRKTWELQRVDTIKEASEEAATDPQSMEKLTRRLAYITAVEEAKLASKYADSVVRGYSHTVRGFMGHLDIKSTAESLQDAKDSFRESALQSLDTGFTREDLSQDPEASVQVKSQLIDVLENQIASLETAIANLSQKYTASAVSAVKLALGVVAATTPVSAIDTAASKGIEELMKKPADDPIKKSVTDIFGDDSKVLDDIGSRNDAVATANAAVNSASQALTEYMSQYATAVAGDTRTMVDSLQKQLTNAKAELADL
ncbi:hypothetical protein MMC15_006264 [Xylographa vitiligo]|nr:hypothetical protein [Xylographa vitiligo]